jgi:hypothetical protein
VTLSLTRAEVLATRRVVLELPDLFPAYVGLAIEDDAAWPETRIRARAAPRHLRLVWSAPEAK